MVRVVQLAGDPDIFSGDLALLENIGEPLTDDILVTIRCRTVDVSSHAQKPDSVVSLALTYEHKNWQANQ